MISKKTQIVELAEGLVNAGIDMACKYGIGNYLVASVFSKRCFTGRNRLLDLKNEYESYLVENEIVPDPNIYMGVLPAYHYNYKTKRYILCKFFFYYLKNVYLKKLDF